MNFKTKAKCLLFFLIIFSAFNFSNAQTPQSQEKMYALSLVTFARSTNWPMMTTKDKVVIGIWQYPPLVVEMNELIKTRNANGKPIEIKDLSDISELQKCDIVFFPSYKYKTFARAFDAIKSNPILIVTNKKDAAKTGGCIDIILMNGKLNYEINLKAIEQRGLKVSNSVKNMGTTIE